MKLFTSLLPRAAVRTSQRSAAGAWLLTSAVCLSALAGCGKSTPAPPAARAGAGPAVDPLTVQIKPEMADRFKVQRLALTDMATVQDVAGRIEANERLVTRIGASVTGRVTEVLADVGDRVRPGQALARVASPDLTTAQLAYLRAHAATTLAERAVERARQLIQADVIGSAEVQRRESELSIARAELQAASDQLRLIGIPGDAIARLRDQGTLTAAADVVSPLPGTVVERKVSRGQVAQPGDPLFTVADLGSVWVVGGLPEQAARTVQPGQAVDIEVPALGKQLSGKIVFVGDTIQSDTRTVAIRTQVDNAARDLKPQMLATMKISGQVRQLLAVPAGTVVRENDRDHVFVKLDNLRVRLTPVELGPQTGGLRPLLKGPSEGTELVTDGAFHLNNERKRAELE